MKTKITRLLALLCALAALALPAGALSAEEALGLLETWYVDTLPPAAYEAETVEELTGAVGDPYTYYMTAREYAAFLSTMEDTTVTGIGVMVAYTEEGIRVEKVLEGGSAQAAGLQPGDLIVAVDGQSCVPANEGHRALIVGAEGSQVAVTVRRADGATITYRLTRTTVEIPLTQSLLLEGRVAYIDCDSFGAETGLSIREAVEAYREEADLFLVDLRGNGGGIAEAAVASSSAFTGTGIKLYLRDGAGGLYYTVSLQEDLTDLPVIFLTDGATASASELFAAVVREEGAGISVGSRTYGKGTAQIVCDASNYPDIFNGDALKITAYRFYTGRGNTTDRIGVIPTLVVEDQYAREVAELLSGAEGPGCLRVTLGGEMTFYVDLARAAQADCAPAYAQLLSALAPQTGLAVEEGGAWREVTPEEAAALAGVDYESRYFSDVEDSPWGGALNALAVCGVLRGTGGGRYQPEAALTRAQLCALLAQALNTGGGGTGTYFSDVDAGAWYAGDVEAMASIGLVAGFPDGTFRPDQLVTQQEFLTVMGRLAAFLSLELDLVLQQGEETPAEGFAPWAAPYAWLLEEYGMLCAGLETADPAGQVTRGEAGGTLYNILTGLEILVQ